MSVYYFLRVKKAYASSVIKDLQKMDAVELMEPEEANIPEWQKEQVRARLKEIKKHPEKVVGWTAAQKKLKQLTK
jgi:hypothetical protein